MQHVVLGLVLAEGIQWKTAHIYVKDMLQVNTEVFIE